MRRRTMFNVTEKSNTMQISLQEAEIEVCADYVTKERNSVDTALLFVVSELKDESNIILLTNNLIQRGANLSTHDDHHSTSLHHAVDNRLRAVAAILLENNCPSHIRDTDGKLPLKIALDKKDDEMCSLLLAYMPNALARQIFSSDYSTPAEVSFHELLNSNMQKTILSVLDCMIEPSTYNTRVYYNILESDEEGRAPDDPKFNPKQKSPFQKIAKMGTKNIVYHDVVRLLIRKKWNKYARFRFQFNTLKYMITLFCLTFAAIVAVSAEDPRVYNSPLHVVRAVTEVVALIMIVETIISEVSQMMRHRLEYLTELFNYMDFSSSILLACVLPLRYVNNNAQWNVFAFGYLFWVVRIFKYAAIFRHTGAYAQILYRVLKHDLPRFAALIGVVLLAFGGSFLMALRGGGHLDANNETSSFWRLLYVGFRTFTVAAPVVDYAGNGDYKTVSETLMVMFMFACIVILLNILIAQLSDTYKKVQKDAQRGLEVDRAWIVARMELNNFFPGIVCIDYRKKYYKHYEDITNLRSVLNEMNSYIKDIWDSGQSQDEPSHDSTPPRYLRGPTAYTNRIPPWGSGRY